MTAATGDSLSFGYDTLKRLNRVTAKSGSSIIMNTAYAYRDVSWNRGSAQVEFRNVRLGSDSGMLLEGKKYSYDKAGNLVMISESTGKYNKLVEYTYDSQNQLTSEAYYKSGEAETYITYNYTYDTAGNLLTVSQKKGNTTTLLQTYTYGDAQWHDLLTAVNGQAITYDASGNPLSYGGWSFGWQNERQLKTASKTSDGKTETLEYSYDADGIRTSKTYTVETFTQVPDYTVTFQADGATVKTMTVEDGYTLKDSDYPAVPAKSGYTGEWVKYTSAVHSNVTVQAKYTAVSTDHTVTFKANGKTVKTMVVPDGYVLQDSDYPPIPPRVGYKGSWSKVTTAIRRDTVIYASYMPNGGGIVIPPQPTSPGEIMSGGEGEPVEADVPAEDETVSPQGMHVTGTQTVTHEYLTLNGKVARETIRTNNTLTAVLDFIYDESGKPFALKYSTNGTSFQTYYYVLNLQGDVVELIHYIPGFEYESVATYEYDAWGNVSSSGRLAEINPLRYRGYYYDNETGFYYLQSRYYDPVNRRFINADGLISSNWSFSGLNMFAYCENDPVGRSDPSGMLSLSELAEKLKQALRYALHAANDFAKNHGIDTAAAGAAVLQMEKDEKGIYHARPDCWQQHFGYTDLYDYAFDAGTSMIPKKFPFTYAGEDYILWLWVGDYINLGAGAEAGIYYGGGPVWLVNSDIAMSMSMDLYYQGDNIISYSAKTWWLTGFNPAYSNVSADDLSATYRIKFDDPWMFYAFSNEYRKTWLCDPSTRTIYYTLG